MHPAGQCVSANVQFLMTARLLTIRKVVVFLQETLPQPNVLGKASCSDRLTAMWFRYEELTQPGCKGCCSAACCPLQDGFHQIINVFNSLPTRRHLLPSPGVGTLKNPGRCSRGSGYIQSRGPGIHRNNSAVFNFDISLPAVCLRSQHNVIWKSQFSGGKNISATALISISSPTLLQQLPGMKAEGCAFCQSFKLLLSVPIPEIKRFPIQVSLERL